MLNMFYEKMYRIEGRYDDEYYACPLIETSLERALDLAPHKRSIDERISVVLVFIPALFVGELPSYPKLAPCCFHMEGFRL